MTASDATEAIVRIALQFLEARRSPEDGPDDLKVYADSFHKTYMTAVADERLPEEFMYAVRGAYQLAVKKQQDSERERIRAALQLPFGKPIIAKFPRFIAQVSPAPNYWSTLVAKVTLADGAAVGEVDIRCAVDNTYLDSFFVNGKYWRYTDGFLEVDEHLWKADKIHGEVGSFYRQEFDLPEGVTRPIGMFGTRIKSK